VAIDTFSSFYFLDTEISLNNQNLNIDEGSGELLAQISIGQFTPTTISQGTKIALDAIGTQEYTLLFNRFTRKLTISADDPFDLLIFSGSQKTTSAWAVLGFTGLVDLTGATSYTGNAELGSVFLPQYKLQDYVAPGFNKEQIRPSVNESEAGVIEVLSFGRRSFVHMSIPFVYDKLSIVDCQNFLPNASGVQDTLDFFDFLITKSKLEFNPDRDDPSIFHTLLLERTNRSSAGTGFLLRERVDESLRDIYDTGLIVFRIAE